MTIGADLAGVRGRGAIIVATTIIASGGDTATVRIAMMIGGTCLAIATTEAPAMKDVGADGVYLRFQPTPPITFKSNRRIL